MPYSISSPHPAPTSISETSPCVFLVDDDVSVRDSVAKLLRLSGWDVWTFGSAQAFLEHKRGPGPCCLVLDVNLPGLDGLELQGQIADQQLLLPIIFITGHGDIPMSVRAMKAGAAEFLTKPLDSDALIAAVASALERSTVASAEEERLRTLRADYDSLTQREREVMALVVTGRLNKQIAFDLGVIEQTVKTHRGQIMRKMHARTFADLIGMASHLGIATTYH